MEYKMSQIGRFMIIKKSKVVIFVNFLNANTSTIIFVVPIRILFGI